VDKVQKLSNSEGTFCSLPRLPVRHFNTVEPPFNVQLQSSQVSNFSVKLTAFRTFISLVFRSSAPIHCICNESEGDPCYTGFRYLQYYFSVARRISVLSAATVDAAVNAQGTCEQFPDSPRHFHSFISSASPPCSVFVPCVSHFTHVSI
jgi:hypothetical protein